MGSCLSSSSTNRKSYQKDWPAKEYVNPNKRYSQYDVSPKDVKAAERSSSGTRAANGRDEDISDESQRSMDHEQLIAYHQKVQRVKVFAHPLDLSEDFVPPSYEKSEGKVKFIEESLADNFIFASLSDKERRLLIGAMVQDEVSSGTEIIKQGDIGDYFYVVEDGTIKFIVDGEHVGGCGKSNTFGELALLYDSPRAATCVANTDCVLWKVDQSTFRRIMANKAATKQKDVQDILRKVPFLSDLDEQTLTKISDALTTVTFPEGEQIVDKGDIGEVFYIIREGMVKITDIGVGDSHYEDQTLGPGDSFGERALLTGEPRVANVTTTTTCKCLCLSRDTFEKTLGPLQKLIERHGTKTILMGVPVFANSKFQPYEMDRLTDVIEEVTFKKGDVLVEEGKPMKQSLYIIQEGAITVANNNGRINHLVQGDYFGQTTLQSQEGSISNATITADEDSKCGVLTKSAVESVIKSVDRLGQAPAPVAKKFDKSIKFEDLNKLRILGMGAFGKVWLVKHGKTGKAYALKSLEKKQIIRYEQVKGVAREKNIMFSIDHPFVVNLLGTFQDDAHLYMAIDLVQGGELFSVIHTDKKDGLPDSNSVFYGACVLEALSHLHDRNICYRDLKPENVLVDAEGYCRMVDFGFAKIVMNKTYTLCGTPEYLAPELIVSKGHDNGVDYWAFGVLIYEMLVGKSPFYSSDQVALYRKIVQGKFTFPRRAGVNDLAQDLIQKLLVKRQADRLGCLAGGSRDIRDHGWFISVDFAELLSKKTKAPWLPKLKDTLDTSNFDYVEDFQNNKSGPSLTQAEQELFEDF